MVRLLCPTVGRPYPGDTFFLGGVGGGPLISAPPRLFFFILNLFLEINLRNLNFFEFLFFLNCLEPPLFLNLLVFLNVLIFFF